MPTSPDSSGTADRPTRDPAVPAPPMPPSHPSSSGVTELLRDLIRAASPNPPGDERAAARVILGFLERIPDIEIEDAGVDPLRPMIVARLRCAAPGPTLLLNGHMDTVPDPFGAKVAGGRMFGRGASDMKSGLAGLVVAFGRIAELRGELAGTVELHAVPDEEPGGHLGTEALLRAGRIAGDYAVVAEPTGLSVFRAQKGNVFADVTVRGRSAHGSMPWHGVNAASLAARLLVDLEDRLGPLLAERSHPLVGPRSLNVGTITAGTATNVVPDRCVLGVDRRVLPGESPRAALEELAAFIGDRGTVEATHLGAPFETPEDHPLVVAAQAAVAAVLGGPRPCGGLVGSSDARFYADGAGIPTILLGPGAMDQAHVPDESVPLEEAEASVPVFVELARRLLVAG